MFRDEWQRHVHQALAAATDLLGAGTASLTLESPTHHRDDEIARVESRGARTFRVGRALLREKGEVIGAVLYEADITDLRTIVAAADRLLSDGVAGRKDSPPDTMDDVIQLMLTRVVGVAPERASRLAAEERLPMLKEMDRRGVFRIEGAMRDVAQYFGISKHTLYGQLQQIRGQAVFTAPPADAGGSVSPDPQVNWKDVVRAGISAHPTHSTTPPVIHHNTESRWSTNERTKTGHSRGDDRDGVTPPLGLRG